MSTLITITVSGETDIDKSIIVYTIRQALADAALDVRDDSDQPPIALTTLYEQQIRLAMTGAKCIVRLEDSKVIRDQSVK